MILTLSNTAPAYNGRFAGSIITSSGLRAVARIRSRPASKRQRQNWRPPFSLANARTTWASLSPGEREAWDDYAAEFVTWPLEGSPRYATGLDSFANYFTVLRLIDPYATTPEAPSEGATWQPQPKFFEFADWESGYYTLKAETDFEENTTILFSSMPPSKTVFNGEWFGEKIVGSHLFEYGLYENDEFDGIHDMIESQFGPIDSTQKIWGRCWEVQTDTGNIRVLKDPCTINPGGAPPVTGLTVTLYNDYYDQTDICEAIALDEFDMVIGTASFLSIDAFDTETEPMVFEDEWTAADVVTIWIYVEWRDFSFLEAFPAYDSSNPWEYTVAPEL